jgi:hypothetical protein
MKSTEYLYGTKNVIEVPQSIIDERIRLLNENLRVLLDVHYFGRDTQRIGDVMRAIEWWNKINEM